MAPFLLLLIADDYFHFHYFRITRIRFDRVFASAHLCYLQYTFTYFEKYRCLAAAFSSRHVTATGLHRVRRVVKALPYSPS